MQIAISDMFKTIISLIPMFVCAFWCIILLLEYKRHNKSKIFLSFFMFVAFLLYLGHAAYFNKEYRFYCFWESIYIFCSLSVYPIYFIYIKLISRKTYLEVKDMWILLPAFLMSVFSFILYFKMSPLEARVYSEHILYRPLRFDSSELTPVLSMQLVKQRLFVILFFVQVIPIIYFGRKYIVEYNNKIYDYYSNTEGKTLQHFKRLIYIFVTTSIASIIANFLGKSFFLDSIWILLIPALLFGCMLFIIGYLGYKQEFTLDTFLTEQSAYEDKLSQRAGKELNNDYYNEKIKHRLLNQLHKLLEKESIYKKDDLRITDVSKKLNTNRTYISKVVNEELKTNFSDLINKYRIEHAKKLLTDVDSQSIGLSQIGELSGFKSDSSFYRIFKEKEGISPGDFRKNFKRKFQ